MQGRACYASLQDAREAVQIKNHTMSDKTLFSVLEGVSQWIDRWLHRTFRTWNGTVVLTPEFDDLLIVPDLLAATTLKSDTNYDGTYATTWTTADYMLAPSNALLDGRPYTKIMLKDRGAQQFASGVQDYVQIAGKWGYYEETEVTDATVSVALTTTATSVSVTAVGMIEVGWTLLIGTEQLYVLSRSADSGAGTLKVLRGVNGTTAAVHDIASVISRYVYPAGITAAALQQTSRIHRRIASPLGIVNTPGQIGSNAINIPKIDRDMIDMLKTFKRSDYMGA